MNEILVQRRVPAAGLPSAATLRQWATTALGAVSGDLTIRIVDAQESRDLNQRFRHQDKPTNVLSFPYDGETLDVQVIGDIVICAEIVQREAAEQGKDPRAHWAHMVVHGCLHLLGYDHDADADAEEMERRERGILAGLGFADPYEAGTARQEETPEND